MICRQAMVAALALASPAWGAPRLELDRCTAFPRDAVSTAVEHELSDQRDLRDLDVVIVIECPDAAAAHIRIEPAPADGEIVRDVDLGEVDDGLRIKMLALAAAELVRTALVPPPPAAPVLPVPISRAIEQSAREVVTVTLPIALRVYLATPIPMVDLGVELALRGFRLGARAALGQTDDALGEVRPWLATAAAGRDLACHRAATAACGFARVELGIAGVSAHASAIATAHGATAPYAAAGLGGELSHRFGGWSLVSDLELGWAEGLIARAGGKPVAHVAGGVVVAALGVRW